MPDGALPPWEQDKSQDNRPVKVPPAETVRAPGSELANIDKEGKENGADGDRELESSSPRAIMQPPPIRALDVSGDGGDHDSDAAGLGTQAAGLGVSGADASASHVAASGAAGAGVGGTDSSEGKRADARKDKGKHADGKVKLSKHAGMKRITTKRRSSASSTPATSSEQKRSAESSPAKSAPAKSASKKSASTVQTDGKSGGRSALFRSSASRKKTQAEGTSTRQRGVSVSSRQQSRTQSVTPPWANQVPGQPANRAFEQPYSNPENPENSGRKRIPRLRKSPNQPQQQESQSEEQESQSQQKRGLRWRNSVSSRGARGGGGARGSGARSSSDGSGAANERQTSYGEASSSSVRSSSVRSDVRSDGRSERKSSKSSKPFAQQFVDTAVGAAAKIVSSLKSLPAAFSGGRVSSRKGQSVALLDSNKVVEIQLKAGQVAAISEDTYNSEFEALQAVSNGRGSKVVVWCGYISAKQSRRVVASEHSSVKPVADARYLMRAFSNKLVAMSGEIAVAPVANPQSVEADKISQHLDSMKARMVVSGMCVGDRDGIWLRVGRSIVEATLMSRGRIRTWTPLCEGLDSVAEKIRGGTPAERARAELAERVASETRRVITTWQRSHTVPNQIWLHGPGGDPAGTISQALLAQSGCRVSPPVLDIKPTGEAMRYITSLPTAVQALTAVQLYRPMDVLKKAGRARTVLNAKIAGAVVAVLIGMTVFANWRGGGIDTRIKTLKQELASLEDDADVIRERDRAIAVKDKIAELIDGVGRPEWQEIIRLYEDQPVAGDNKDLIAEYSGTDLVSFSVTDSIAALDSLTLHMTELAKKVYGEGASATVVPQKQTLLSDKTEFQISLKGPSVQ